MVQPRLKSNIWKLYLIAFFKQTQFFGALVVPYFIDWLKVDYTKMFILQAWFMLWIFLLEVPTGYIADRFGRKHSIALGCLIGGISISMFGFVGSYWLLFIVEFFDAMSIALISGADSALVYDTLKGLKKKKDARFYFSRYESLNTIAIVVSLPLGSLIAGTGIFSYPKSILITFILTGVFSLIAFIISFTLVEPERKRKLDNIVKEGIDGFKFIFKHPKLRAFSLNFALISAVTFFMFWFYQSLLAATKVPVTYNGFVGAGFNIFGVLLLLNLKRIEKLVGITNALFLSAIVPGLMYIGLFFLSGNVLFSLAAVFLVTGLKLMRKPVLFDFMNRHIDSRNRATVLSGVSMLERAGITIIYPLVGVLSDISLNYTFLFLGVATTIFALFSRVEASHIS